MENRSLWAIRSKDAEWVDLWFGRPDWDEKARGFQPNDGCNCLGIWTIESFEQAFGVRPKPREAIQIRLSVEVIQRLKGGEG